MVELPKGRVNFSEKENESVRAALHGLLGPGLNLDNLHFWTDDQIANAVQRMSAAIGSSFKYLPNNKHLINPQTFVLNSPFQDYQTVIGLAIGATPAFSLASAQGVDMVEQFIGWIAHDAVTKRTTHCRTYYDVVMTAKGYFYLRSHEVSWLLMGFPRVTLESQRYAASLMSTVISPKVIPELIPPWDAFCIDVPPGLIETKKGSLRRVRVYYESLSPEKHWNVMAELDHRTLIRLSLTTDQLTKISEMETERVMPEVKGVLLDDEYERVMVMVGRLVLNVVVAMTDKDRVPNRKVPTGGKKGQKSFGRKYPATTMFTLGAPVRVIGSPEPMDTRPLVRDFIAGRVSTPLSVRRIVAGHWKWQVHGPRNTLRKWIHVEPYEQGPEGAPLLFRPHIIAEKR